MANRQNDTPSHRSGPGLVAVIGAWSRRPLLTLALVFMLTLTVATPAVGDGGDELIWQAPVPSSDRGAVFAIYFHSGTASKAATPAGVSATSACSETHPDIHGVNQWGEQLWRLQLNVSWCYDGAVNTYYFSYHDAPTWSDWWNIGTEEDTTSYPQTGNPQTSQYHRHHFARCANVPEWVCWDDVHPWLRVYVYGDGYSSSSAGN
jgi:hypothetical protein